MADSDNKDPMDTIFALVEDLADVLDEIADCGDRNNWEGVRHIAYKWREELEEVRGENSNG